MPELSSESLRLFIEYLDPDDARAAAERYETLRLKLTRCVVWKGCPESQADALADEVIDRVAAKIAAGANIENLNAYACEVLRYVWLEHSRRRREDTAGDDLPEIAVEPVVPVLDHPDERLNCLRKCMNEVVPGDNDRLLIVGYYDADAGKKNKDQRKELAAKLGLTMTTLKVKACRLRAKLEKCINHCVEKVVTKTQPDATRY